MGDPVAVRQAENVLRTPMDRVLADAAHAVAFDHVADRIAGRAERDGFGPIDLHQITVEERHGRAAGHRVDVMHAARPVPAPGGGAHGGSRLRPGIAEHG